MMMRRPCLKPTQCSIASNLLSWLAYLFLFSLPSQHMKTALPVYIVEECHPLEQMVMRATGLTGYGADS